MGFDEHAGAGELVAQMVTQEVIDRTKTLLLRVRGIDVLEKTLDEQSEKSVSLQNGGFS